MSAADERYDDDLEEPPDRPRSGSSSDDRTWAMLCHLSALLTGWFGLGFLGPLIVWQVQKEKSRFIDEHGKEALNFQLTLLIIALIVVSVSAVLFFVTCGIGVVLIIPALLGFAIYAIVMPIIAGVKASAGEHYRYPATIRFLS